jgi:cytochrome P450/NADPH-cytochrome P450 reductase
VDWLRNLHDATLDAVRFAVFGCGNSEWASTYQKIPTLCDGLLEKHGAIRLVQLGAGDASQGDFFQKFDDFEVGLWEALSKVRTICGLM